MTTTVKDIPRDKLTPGQFQNRDLFEEQRLAELAASIAESGIIQPILVRPNGKGTWQIIDGERRWRAAGRAGLATVPCIVRELDDAAHAEGPAIATVEPPDEDADDDYEGAEATGDLSLDEQLAAIDAL